MDMEGSRPKTIAILIKTPSQAVEDQTIEGVHLNWTVKDLKTHLSAVYPTKLVSVLRRWLMLAEPVSPVLECQDELPSWLGHVTDASEQMLLLLQLLRIVPARILQ